MAINFNEFVPQTSRVILFDKFNSEKKSLLDFLNLRIDEKGNVDEKILTDVSEYLEVHSFKEFCEKFEPAIYQEQPIMDQNTGEVIFNYSEKFTEGSKKISICASSFYKMVEDIIEKREISEKTDLEFDFSAIRELLSPGKALAEAERQRKELENMAEAYLEAKEKDRSEEAEVYKKRMSRIAGEIGQKYMNNAVELLPLAIADGEVKIQTGVKLLGENKISVNEETSVINTPKLISCSLVYNEDGELVPKEIEETDTSETEDKTVAEDNYLLAPMEKLSKQIPAIKDNDTMKKLFLSCYSGSGEKFVPTEEKMELLVSTQNRNVKMYKKSQQSFINAVAELVQKVINVEMFFKHANSEGKTFMPLIIANCTVDEAIDKKVKLNEYLKQLNTSVKSRIWYAILPSADMNSKSSEEAEGDLFDIFGDEESAPVNDIAEKHKNSLDNIKAMANILSSNEIISFFNFEANEETSFSGFKSEFKNYNSKIKGFEKNSTVLCYPNFTVIPKKETDIVISSNIKVDCIDSEVQKEVLKVPAIYVDAAYVAAGTVISLQDSTALENNGFLIKKHYPNISIDIEKNSSKFQTHFPRETTFNWTDDFKNEINKEHFGFCFSDDVKESSQKVDIHIARCNNGKPFCNLMVKKYFDVYFRTIGLKSVSEIKSRVDEINLQLDKAHSGNRSSDGNDNIILSSVQKLRLDDSNKKKPIISIQFGEYEEPCYTVDVIEENESED
ncbi:MAG: hypothetical protein Q4D76_13920 [Oscillospiraceae bacterium]|nr:hypothetical protein [Oscillospiraceae bacterium]